MPRVTRHKFKGADSVVLAVCLFFVYFFASAQICYSQAYSTDLYALSRSGNLYLISRTANTLSKTKFVRKVPAPSYSGPSGDLFKGLIWKGNRFYTTFGIPAQIIEFGFNSGDEINLGSISIISPSGLALSVSSDDSVWITYPSTNFANTRITKITLNPPTIVNTITPSPQLISSISYAPGFWEASALTFDIQGRLVFSPGFAERVGRFDNIAGGVGAWKKNCSLIPCWGGTTYLGALATDPENGDIYGAAGGSLLKLALPEDSAPVYTNVLQGSHGLFSTESAIGLAFGPIFPETCDFYLLPNGTTVCF